MALTDEQRREAQWILSPEKWANFPILPVKRYEKQDGTQIEDAPECGFVVWDSIEADRPVVVLHNVWAAMPDVPPPTLEYASLEEMVADGWMGD